MDCNFDMSTPILAIKLYIPQLQPGLSSVFPVFAQTMFGLLGILGEAIFFLWLLIQGVKTV